ncbi:ABC transporter ATP-binding protein [Terrabacter terrae]|uniref:ABC transporter ATP-binding protein n=1 Tax=Terrabacter terrae TaxID=318434 RepID=A0ABN2TSI2_9MICO
MTSAPDTGISERTGLAVRVEHVSKSYRLGDGSTLTAADDVTLHIEAGRFTCVVGASGSGKSTLLHLIGAIDRPDAGTIRVGEQDITSLSRRALADYRAGVGFVFQQFHLIPALTVTDNVLAPLVGRKISDDRRARAHDLLEAVGLADRKTALPSQLSGGQQQRVAIARALIGRPSVLLADEPTGNLDSQTAAGVMQLLVDLQHEHGTTLVMATHDQGIARSAERIIHITDGRPHSEAI